MWRHSHNKTLTDAADQGVRAAELDQLHAAVLHLFALVSEGLAAATAAFLTSDREAARLLNASEQVVDSVYGTAERLVRRGLVSREATAEQDLRLLLVVLQIVPELERSGDLVQHIAVRAGQGLAKGLTPRTRGIVERMGAVATDMWRAATVAYADRDPTAAARLRLRDDELDDLHVTLTDELATMTLPMAAAIEMGLVARFFERLGDHAVNISRRVESLGEAA